MSESSVGGSCKPDTEQNTNIELLKTRRPRLGTGGHKLLSATTLPTVWPSVRAPITRSESAMKTIGQSISMTELSGVMEEADRDSADALERAASRIAQQLQVCLQNMRISFSNSFQRGRIAPTFVMENMSTLSLQKTHSCQFPDQLDKIEQLKIRISRKKAAIDARLKSAVSSQLDDIASCLDQLRRCVCVCVCV